MKNKVSAIAILCMTACLIGCQVLIAIKAEFRDDQLVFSPENDKKKAFRLYDFAVFELKCPNECVYWRIRRDTDTDAPLAAAFVKEGEVVYGKALDGLIVAVPPKSLVPGRYGASGHLKIDGSRGANSFHYAFEILADENGNLTVETIENYKGEDAIH